MATAPPDTDRSTPDADPGALAREARLLVRRGGRATLGSAQHDADGWPYASLVLAAADQAGRPLLLLSALAEHSRNIARDARVSLQYDATAGLDEPLTGARLTVLGTAARCTPDQGLARYLARHPYAEAYAGFADFALYRVAPARAQLVAGFGRIHWIDGARLTVAEGVASALADAEADIVAHMNADHAEAVAAYAHGLLGRGGGGWRMTGIDADGIDLRAAEPEKGADAVARLDFDQAMADAADAREVLAGLARRARAGAPGAGT